MTRTSFMNWQIALAWISFGMFAASKANAGADETLVLSAPTVSGENWTWEQADKAIALQTRDSGWQLRADVAPTARIKVCKNDPTVLAGTQASCTTRYNTTPVRDNWAPFTDIYAMPPPAQKSTDIKVTWNHPSNMTDIIGYRVQLRLQGCNPAQPNCPAEGYGTPIDLGIVESYTTSVPGTFFEVCASVLPRAEDRFGTYIEGCNRGALARVLNLKVEFTTREQ